MGGYDCCENCNDDYPIMFSPCCCELCGRELRNFMLPDHNMMFVARWMAKFRSVDVLLEGPS
jgi:hypothetical protein